MVDGAIRRASRKVMAMRRSPANPTVLWAFAVAILSLLLFAYPMYVIRPFRFQGPRELQAAMWLASKLPWITLLLLIVVLVLLILYFSRKRAARMGWDRWLVITFTLFFAGLAAFASRVNIYEKMFNPIKNAIYVDASRAALAPSEMVMVVKLEGEARAYPIYIMGYHHILNERLKGIPIAVTY
jgi:hypothetical protein